MNVIAVFAGAAMVTFIVGLLLWMLAQTFGGTAVAIITILALTVGGLAAAIEYFTSDREKP